MWTLARGLIGLERLGNFGIQYTTNSRILNEVFVDLQRLMKNLDRPKTRFNIRSGGLFNK